MGFKKGNIPWNKGITGITPWNKGKKLTKLSDETKVKKGFGKVIDCDYCGESMYRQNNAIKSHNFCNRQCYAQYRTGKDLGGWIHLKCDECSREFKRQRHLVNTRPESSNVFCSSKCYSKFKAIHGNTPYTIGKTRPEREVEKILKDNNIEYIYNKLFNDNKAGIGYFDFYLPAKNLVIEVDGNYWHGNPKYYPKLNSQQLGCIERDKEKETILKNLNVNLERIWENEINSLNLLNTINKY